MILQLRNYTENSEKARYANMKMNKDNLYKCPASREQKLHGN
jgi:hypothetical protein